MTQQTKSLNPWEVLGLPKDATDREIKKAFRDLAKEHHPDKGGDGEIFAQISRAFALIENKEARKRYEKDKGKPVKSLNAMAMEVILLKIMAGIQKAQNINDLKYKPIIRKCEAAFQDDLIKMREDHKHNRWQMSIMADLAERFTYNGEEEGNFIANAIKDEIRGTKLTLKQIEHQMRIAARALTLLDKYEFRTALRESRPTNTFMWTSIGDR